MPGLLPSSVAWLYSALALASLNASVLLISNLVVGVRVNIFLRLGSIFACILRNALSTSSGVLYGINCLSVFINSKNQDPNLQVVEATTQAISSSIGGADLIEIDTIKYDLENYSNLFSNRITRNIQNVLEQESFLNKTLDASKGSYFIDNLTINLIKEVWKYFIEA